MITSKTLLKLLNEQIRNEMYSSQFYLAMSGWFETTPYKGFAAKYRESSLEEHQHGMKFFDYLCDRDGEIEIFELAKPKASYSSVLEAVTEALSEERKITKLIRSIYDTAEKEGDFETKQFLNDFLAEQVREEKEAKELVEYVQAAGDNSAAMLMIDRDASPSKR